jgi:glucose/arabinose dehydrogenase
VHPRFASNQQLVYFTYPAGDAQANQTRVARARLIDHRLEWLTLLHAVTPAKTGGQHFGFRLLWLPDGTLLVSVGDGGNPPIELNGKAIRLQAQNRGSGRAVKSWKGNLFAGGLVSGDVRRIQLSPSGEVLSQSSLPVGDRLRDVREGPDGHLHVLTDGAGDVALIRLEPAGSSSSP